MAVSVLSQDLVKTSPKLYKVLLDNDQVRVVEFGSTFTSESDRRRQRLLDCGWDFNSQKRKAVT
jgi:hypothetical protein